MVTKQMKKIFMCAVTFAVMVCLTACGNVSAEGPAPSFIVSTSISNTPGVSVTVNQTTSKLNFQFNGYYSDRFYDSYGELDTINIMVSGTISRAECPVGTDFFRFSIKAPNQTTSIIVQDINYEKYSAADIKNGYFDLDIMWLDNFDYYGRLCGTDKVNCFYIAFCNELDDWDWTPLEKYFVYITYDLTFID